MNSEMPWIEELRRSLGTLGNIPMVEMSEEERTAFRLDHWHPVYGPALGTIGNFVIYDRKPIEFHEPAHSQTNPS